MENIYGIYTGSIDKPTFHYVGKTSRSVEHRFAEHMRDASNPLAHKPLYEVMRHIGLDKFNVLLLDTTESGLTEQDFVRALILEGHPLTNANLGNSKVAKKRTKSTFAELNRQAEERLEAAERRKRLHSDAQTLSKPEIVHQRVTNGIVDADTLAGMDWRSAPPELMKWGTPPKNPEAIDCKLLKYGDFNIYVAFKKGKWAFWCKNTRNNTADAYKVNWRSAPKWFGFREACEQIVNDWPGFIWWPLGRD